MTNFYKNMLNLEFWHDFLLDPDQPFTLPDDYDISGLLSLIPTSDCKQILRKLRWFLRSTPFGGTLVAYVNQVEPDIFELQIPITRPERLTFWLIVQDAYFSNFTNLPLTTNRNQIYYFSNLYDSWQAETLFLTHPLPPYQAEEEYLRLQNS